MFKNIVIYFILDSCDLMKTFPLIITINFKYVVIFKKYENKMSFKNKILKIPWMLENQG